MAHHGILRDYRFSDDVDDVRGATLYGIDDEKLGKIDDLIFDHASGTIQYVVVDSGGWFSSKKFVVPAEHIRPYGKDEKDFSIDMTKRQVESLPPYDEDKFGKDKDWNEEHWNQYDKDYQNSLETSGGVLHREDSTHTITPGPDQLPATGAALRGEDALSPDRVAGIFPETAPNPSKIRLRPGGLGARAEDTSAPGQYQTGDIPTGLEESELDEDVDVNSRRAPIGTTTNTTGLDTANTVGGAQRGTWNTTTSDVSGTDPNARRNRLSAFEEHLRRNRVDITGSCRSCDVEKDKVA